MKTQTNMKEEMVAGLWELRGQHHEYKGWIPVQLAMDHMKQSLDRLEKSVREETEEKWTQAMAILYCEHCGKLVSQEWVDNHGLTSQKFIIEKAVERYIKQSQKEEYVADAVCTIHGRKGCFHRLKEEDRFTSKNGWEDYEDPVLGKIKINTNFGRNK